VVRHRRGEKALDDGIASEGAALRAGPEFWGEVLEWGRANRTLTPKESGILEICADMPSRLPSAKQAAVAFRTLDKLRDKGWEGVLPS